MRASRPHSCMHACLHACIRAHVLALAGVYYEVALKYRHILSILLILWLQALFSLPLGMYTHVLIACSGMEMCARVYFHSESHACASPRVCMHGCPWKEADNIFRPVM